MADQNSSGDVQSKGSDKLGPGIPQVTDGQKPAVQGPSFDQIVKLLAFGLGPQAPRLAEQYMTGAANAFGGYTKGYTNRSGVKGIINFTTLRQVAERSPLLSAIVSTRLHQAPRFARRSDGSKKGEVGFKVMHKLDKHKDFDVPDAFKIFCRQVEEMFLKPWRVFWNDGVVFDEIEPSLAGFLQKITEDTLVINRPCIELGLDPNRVPRAFGAIDGANVIPTFAAINYLTTLNRDYPKDFRDNYAAYRTTMGMIGDRYQLSIDERTQYIYISQGRPMAAFRYDELIVAPIMPTTDISKAGYPRSMTERAMFLILAEILAMTANQRYFEFGNMAETIIGIRGQWEDKHITDFTNIMAANMSGIQGMHRVPVIALPNGKDDLTVIQGKQNHRDMLFDVYIQKLTNLACAIFRMHPSEINEAPRAGDNSGSLSQASQTKQINMAQEQGLESLLQHYKIAIFDPILERIHPDLTWEWDYGQNEMESIQVTLAKKEIMTVDELRAEQGMEPLGAEKGGDVISNPIVMQAMQMKAQADQAKQQQAQGGQPPGQPGEGDSGDEDTQDQEPSEDDASQSDEEDESDAADDGEGPQGRDESDDEFVKRVAQLTKQRKGASQR
jgi:hypothetical protein